MQIVGIICFCFLGLCLDNGLALVPPKGWLSWQYIRCNINCTDNPDGCLNEKLIKRTADYMVKTGLRDSGYEYIVIDDCWMQKTRDHEGRLVPDPERFPSGIRALADYIHKKGLKFGIYADMGLKTCKQYPGSLLYLQVDATTFANWGVDYLKMDGCSGGTTLYDVGYPLMSLLLNQTGRRILFSCSWPDYEGNPNYTNVAKYCNIWRNAADIQDAWSSLVGIIEDYGENKGDFLKMSGPGHFNDPDMLLVGAFGLSYEAQRSQMIMWAMLAAPLMISNDVARLDSKLVGLLRNRYILALDNDPLGKSAVLYEKKDTTRVWFRELSNGRFAFSFLSFSTAANYYHYTTRLTTPNNVRYAVRELTTNIKIAEINNGDYFTATLVPYGTCAIVLVPIE